MGATFLPFSGNQQAISDEIRLKNYKAMIQNYLKIALRNLTKNKMYSFINIGGLAVGMTVAILIGLWVYDEVSYNHSHTNYKNIAQVYRRNIDPVSQNIYSYMGMPQPVDKILTEKYGHLFKHVAIIWWDTDYTIQTEGNNFIKRGQYIEKEVIDMFSLQMVRGNKESLNDPKAIIISQSTAEAIFGNEDPMNKLVKLSGRMDAIITGVYTDIAPNSLFGHIHFFGNWEGLKNSNEVQKANETNWGNNASRILVQTADNVSIEQASAAIADLYIKDTPEGISEYSKKFQTRMWLNPMKDWYLYSEFKDGFPSGGRITFVWLFAIAGVFVLLLACINFMNLSTARSEKRAKEVGIRKAIGSMRTQLVHQFLSESFAVVLLALILAILIIALSLPYFNELTEKKMNLPFTNLYFWLISFAFLLITSFLAGLYPAFYLSSFQPVKVLKGTLRIGKFASLPRKLLVVMQVSVSVILIIGTMIVYRQIQYVQNRPVGYDREGLIRIPIHDPALDKNKLILKEQLLTSGIANEITFASSPVTAIWDNWSGFGWNGKNPETDPDFTVTWIDEQYGKTIQWKILQGRDFSLDHRTDIDAVIINKATAQLIGIENPVGEFITNGNEKRQIIGVVDDVISMSPYESVRPGFYWLAKNQGDLSQMLIRLDRNHSTNEALTQIELMQRRLVNSVEFEYSFIDEEYGMKFKAEQRIGKLASLFAVLAIFISCLGLFGLSSFMAEQKTKEIGVRKVIGASIFNIWSLLSREFVVLVIIAFAIAVPIAYHYLNTWLLSYEYHTTINPLVFVYSGIGTLFITLSTVSFQSIKAAIANPVKSLRSE